MTFHENKTPMKNYVRVPRIRPFGATLSVHWSVLLVIAGCAVLALSDPLDGIIAVGCYFGVILVHECGHGWIATRLGYSVCNIRLSIVHGECEYLAHYRNTKNEALVACGGVAAQFVAALTVWAFGFIPLVGDSQVFGPFIVFFGLFGPLIAFMNLAPSRGLDGDKAWALVPILWREFKARPRKRRKRSTLKVVK